MAKAQFLLLLDQLLDQEAGTLKGDELLSELKQWDSLALMGFIALLDQHFAVSVPASAINQSRSVADLINLVKDKVV